ncbi:MAG: protein-L-isoaspartate O-methyltransferase [Gammaproteobacteria bacterium]
MDIEAARDNMIARQIRPWNVLTEQTLAALRHVRREEFVPAGQRHLAFADVRIPLGRGEVMPEPKVDARMMEALELRGGECALAAGAGSGYLAALLASVCARVCVVEEDARLLELARGNLRRAGIGNVTLHAGDAHAGWGAPGEFDAIVLSRSLPNISDAWAGALADGGRLVGIEGQLPAMQVVRLQKCGRQVTRKSLFETVAPRFQGVVEEEAFEF